MGWCQHLVARRSCIPKETRNVITFPPIVTLIYFKKTFNHLSQTKTAATIKKSKRKIMNILNQRGNYTIYFAIDMKRIFSKKWGYMPSKSTYKSNPGLGALAGPALLH